jgi:hypothetical protein
MCHWNPAKLTDDAGPSKSVIGEFYIKGINKLNDAQLYPSINQIRRFLSSQSRSILPQGLHHPQAAEIF